MTTNERFEIISDIPEANTPKFQKKHLIIAKILNQFVDLMEYVKVFRYSLFFKGSKTPNESRTERNVHKSISGKFEMSTLC